jgi:tetratricopeptide (TPR) repeat protein
VLAYLKEPLSPVHAWAIIDAIQQLGTSNDAEFNKSLADARRSLGDALGLSYAARYEEARLLTQSADKATVDRGRKLFDELIADALKEGMLPLIDNSVRSTFVSAGQVEWQKLVRRSAAELGKKHGGHAVLLLAWQVQQLGDNALADEMYSHAAAACTGDRERRLVQLATVDYLVQQGHTARADALLQKVLEDEVLSHSARLWRTASSLAFQRNQKGRAVAALEKAMDLEFRALPDIVNVQTVRNDYAGLLSHYEQLAAAITFMGKDPTQEFVAKVVRAADRWRSIDPEPTAACQAAAKVLRQVGANDLAWDYLTTPVGIRSNEAAPWLNMAQALRQEADFDLADRAYAMAFEAESTNAQILWDRAQNLQQAGRLQDALQVYRRLAEGSWQDRFQGLRHQAQSMLQGR